MINLRNDGALPFLADDAVVEVPAHVGPDGVRPAALPELTGLERGLVAHVSAYEELDRRLRVERAAAAREQLRLLRHRLVGVELQQLALDLRDLLGPRLVRPLVLHHAVVLVEVVEVVRAEDTEPPHEVRGQAGRRRDAVDVLAEQVREDVLAVRTHADLPREVVQADVVELDGLRRHA